MFTRKHCCKWLKSAVQTGMKIFIFWFIIHLEIMFTKQKYWDFFLKSHVTYCSILGLLCMITCSSVIDIPVCCEWGAPHIFAQCITVNVFLFTILKEAVGMVSLRLQICVTPNKPVVHCTSKFCWCK